MIAESVSNDIANVLVENHRRCLRFVESRVASRQDAEEVLQQAYVKSTEGAHALRDSESAEAWFYRLLRNALVDYYRRRAAQPISSRTTFPSCCRDSAPSSGTRKAPPVRICCSLITAGP